MHSLKKTPATAKQRGGRYFFNPTLKKSVPAVAVILILLLAHSAYKQHRSLVARCAYSQIVYDRQGQVLRITLSRDEKYRIYTPIANINPDLTEAILLKEDHYFYIHPGVNPFSLIRALVQTCMQDSRKIGGSTITMQVARLYYKLKTRSIGGKLKQIAYALWLEMNYTKQDILETYLNIAPCGGNIEGFPAASLIYFEKEAADLTLQEILFLSVLPQKPVARDPQRAWTESDLIHARKNLFNQWVKKHPGAKSGETHIHMPLEVSHHLPFHAPHFVNAVLRKYPERKRIHTTLDMTSQQRITRLTRRYVQRKKYLGVYNAAALLVNAENMEVLASLGSADFFNDKIQGQVDGTRSRRSPGSTLKPFIYALAIEQGLIHPLTMLEDAPTSFSEYTPDNYQSDFKGPVKAFEALITSRNVPAVALASQIENPDLYDFLYDLRLGDLKPKGHYGLSIVLGGAEFSMAELTELYGILSNQGVFQKLNLTFDASLHNLPAQTSLSPEVCRLILDMLQKNPGSKKTHILSVDPHLPVAYKTGTSIGFKDSWSVGIFGNYILAVWLGNFDGTGNPEFIGRTLATPLMFEIIDAICRDTPLQTDPIRTSGRLVKLEVCAVSGRIPHPHCKRRMKTWYIPGKSPIEKCDICREIYINTQTGYRTFKRKGNFIRKEVVEFWPTHLLRLFRQAGVPRKTPPVFDPREDFLLMSMTGIRPEIVSPLKNTEYIMRQEDAMYNDLPLLANTDADVQEVYWFIDEQFIGRADPNTTQYWSLAPGTFRIGVVDDHGRSDARTVKVVLAQ